jgi:hypothetical protein
VLGDQGAHERLLLVVLVHAGSVEVVV